jgi:hypothetical protein
MVMENMVVERNAVKAVPAAKPGNAVDAFRKMVPSPEGSCRMNFFGAGRSIRNGEARVTVTQGR